ncbi:MAG: glycosyltransferase [Acidobacteriaceae bacterium]|nr:glycosyltransferase [Acidobacteriaceae bacterium]MBV9294233.1 glycosyltransferase [Acidobacteriaceae bacterium]MBV9767365.1 glycosyltransferase [Acidobacteriaceae bacterium]
MRTPKDSLIVEEPRKGLGACVVVPVRNEETLLPAALHALAEQRTLTGDPVRHELYEVILLINNSTDRSYQVARSFQDLYPSFQLHVAERTFDKSEAHIGYVRRLLMDEACRRLESASGTDPLILSTDSDSRVAPNWIAQNQAEFRAGAEAVGGRIIVLPCEQDVLCNSTRDLHRYDHLYRRLVSWTEARFDPESHDPWPRHHHHFGASLAVTPQIYRKVGRLPPRRCLEDLAFYAALIRNDVRLRHSNRVKVFTSGRLTGRTRFGLSRQLRDWQDCGRSGLRMPVETRRFLEHLFVTRHRLRRLWMDFQNSGELSASRVQQLAILIGVKPTHLIGELRSAQRFGMLLEELDFYGVFRETWPDRIRLGSLKRVVEEFYGAFKSDQQRLIATPARRSDKSRSEIQMSETMPGFVENVHARRPLGVGNPVPMGASGLIASDRHIQPGL